MYGVQTLTINKVNSYDGSTIDGGLIWGDGPEGISAALLDTAAYGRALTNVKLTAGKTYEAEYYLHNRTGTNVIMAICVKNTSTSQSGSVTLLKSAMVNATSAIYKQGLMASCEKSSLNRTLTVNPATSAYSDQGCTALVNTGVLSNKYISNARVRFKVNSGSDLRLKIIVVKYQSDWLKRAGWTNLVNAADLNQQNPLAASGTPYSASTSFTGLFSNVARNVTVPNLNPFRLCWGGYNNMDGDPVSGSITVNSTRVIDCYNSGEFEDPTNTLPFKRNGNKGNFGVVYAIYCSNANANYIRIKPTRAQEGSYTVKINGIWQSVSATQSTPAKLALSGGHSIWFALTGGNTGDIELQFTQS